MKAIRISLLIIIAITLSQERINAQVVVDHVKGKENLKKVRGVWNEYLVTRGNVTNNDEVDTLFLFDEYNDGSLRRERLSSVLKIKIGDRTKHKITFDASEALIYKTCHSYNAEGVVELSILDSDYDSGDDFVTGEYVTTFAKVLSISKRELVVTHKTQDVIKYHYFRK